MSNHKNTPKNTGDLTFSGYIWSDITSNVKVSFMPNIQESVLMPKIKKVVHYNEKATVIFWSDNTKTVAVCGEGDKFDPEKGYLIALAKRFHGSYERLSHSMSRAKHQKSVKND